MTRQTFIPLVGGCYYHFNKASFYYHSFIIRFVITVLSSKMDME
jgi:hypothetical protein